MSEEKNNSTQATVLTNLSVLATPEGFQKYLLGTKKNGQPRAVYDIVKDYTGPKKKKKKEKEKKHKKHKKVASTYAFYLNSKKKKKKHKKGKKHWHI